MLTTSPQDWRSAAQKKVMFFGMSGLGKTHLSNLLRASGGWFHYSVDYRIGTRYMGEHIVDNFKKEAMKTPFLAELLRSDSIYIASNITFDNLAPLSTYLGKPGAEALGGIPFEEYLRRQRLHRAAEISAMLDVPHFIARSAEIYGYDHFICDTSGSVIEVVNPDDRNDPVLSALAPHVLPVWIKGDEGHLDLLTERFNRAPKPMYYPEALLLRTWEAYLREKGCAAGEVNPNDFIRYGYRALLFDRLPRYERLAQNWGVTILARDVAQIRDAEDFETLITEALSAAHISADRS